MMPFTEEQIRLITDEIVRELNAAVSEKPAKPACARGELARREAHERGGLPECVRLVHSEIQAPAYQERPDGRWLCDTIDEAVANALEAQKRLAQMSLAQRRGLIDAMRKASIDNAERLARLANEETGYGRVEDKIKKNVLQAKATPGTEDLHTEAQTGDNGLMIVERAPFGVIGSITPSTNPAATVINNSISMIAAGNAVVFNPHPAAKRASQEAMRILNEAIAAAGIEEPLITTVREPSLESGNALMTHKDISLLSVTGGEAVVSVAMKSGKRVIAAGPGNPPVIVDDTADISDAARKIVDGASFDNNVLCIAEKEVFAFSAVADQLMAEMEKCGAFKVRGEDINKIVRTVLTEKDGGYIINRSYVGRDAAVILRDSGISFSGNPRLIIAEVDKRHPFIMVEMLMPVLGVVRVKNCIDEAIEQAVMAERGCRHTAIIHSTNVHHMSKAAKRLNTTIFVKNAPSFSGLGFDGEGCTTMTIATPTGDGITSAKSFTRYRRCVLYGDFRIC